MQQLEEGGPDPLVFVLNANLLAMVKLVNCECSAQAVETDETERIFKSIINKSAHNRIFL